MKRNKPENFFGVHGNPNQEHEMTEISPSIDVQPEFHICGISNDALNSIFSWIPFGYLPYIARSCKRLQNFAADWFIKYQDSYPAPFVIDPNLSDFNKITDPSMLLKFSSVPSKLLFVPPLRPSQNTKKPGVPTRLYRDLSSKNESLVDGPTKNQCILNVISHGDVDFVEKSMMTMTSYSDSDLLENIVRMSYKYNRPQILNWVKRLGYVLTLSKKVENDLTFGDFQTFIEEISTRNFNITKCLEYGRFWILQQIIEWSISKQTKNLDKKSFQWRTSEFSYTSNGLIETVMRYGDFEQIKWCLEHIQFCEYNNPVRERIWTDCSPISESIFRRCAGILIFRKDLDLLQKFFQWFDDNHELDNPTQGPNILDIKHRVMSDLFTNTVTAVAPVKSHDPENKDFIITDKDYFFVVVKTCSEFVNSKSDSKSLLQISPETISSVINIFGYEAILELKNYMDIGFKNIIKSFYFCPQLSLELMEKIYKHFESERPPMLEMLLCSISFCNFEIFEWAWNIYITNRSSNNERQITDKIYSSANKTHTFQYLLKILFDMWEKDPEQTRKSKKLYPKSHKFRVTIIDAKGVEREDQFKFAGNFLQFWQNLNTSRRFYLERDSFTDSSLKNMLKLCEPHQLGLIIKYFNFRHLIEISEIVAKLMTKHLKKYNYADNPTGFCCIPRYSVVLGIITKAIEEFPKEDMQ